jgi:hypothetical protein
VQAEARAIFPEAIVVRDFDAFQIKRGELMKINIQGEKED